MCRKGQAVSDKEDMYLELSSSYISLGTLNMRGNGQAVKDKEDMNLEFFREVVRRTAQLVAAWQCVGFCHGARTAALGLTVADGMLRA